MEMLDKKIFDAFDGTFTEGQLQDILNMILHAEKNGKNAHDELVKNPPSTKKILKSQNKLIRMTGDILVCPACGKKLNHSPIAANSEKYEKGYRTYLLCGASCCKGKGCGYHDFVKFYIK